MLTLIFQEDADICERDESVVCFIEFVIPSMHSSELLDKPEVSFDNISPLVQLLVVLPGLLAIALRWHNRTHRKHFWITQRRIRPLGTTIGDWKNRRNLPGTGGIRLKWESRRIRRRGGRKINRIMLLCRYCRHSEKTFFRLRLAEGFGT